MAELSAAIITLSSWVQTIIVVLLAFEIFQLIASAGDKDEGTGGGLGFFKNIFQRSEKSARQQGEEKKDESLVGSTLFDELRRVLRQKKEDNLLKEDAEKVERILNEAEDLLKQGKQAEAMKKLAEAVPALQRMDAVTQDEARQNMTERAEDEELRKKIGELIKSGFVTKEDLEQQRKQLQQQLRTAPKEQQPGIRKAIADLGGAISQAEAAEEKLKKMAVLAKEKGAVNQPAIEGGEGGLEERLHALTLFRKIEQEYKELYAKLANTHPLKQAIKPKGSPIPPELETGFDQLRKDVIAYEARLGKEKGNINQRLAILRRLHALQRRIPAHHRDASKVPFLIGRLLEDNALHDAAVKKGIVKTKK